MQIYDKIYGISDEFRQINAIEAGNQEAGRIMLT